MTTATLAKTTTVYRVDVDYTGTPVSDELDYRAPRIFPHHVEVTVVDGETTSYRFVGPRELHDGTPARDRGAAVILDTAHLSEPYAGLIREVNAAIRSAK